MLKDKAEEKKAAKKKKSRNLLSCEGVADFFGVSPQTVRKIAAGGGITPIHLSPRCVRYDIREVRRYVEARRAVEEPKPTPPPVVGCDGGGWRRIEIRRANRSRVALTLDVEVILSLWDMGVITPSATDPNLYDSDHLSIYLRRDRGPARFQIYLHPMRQGPRRSLVTWILGVAGRKGSAPLHRNGDFSDWRAENLRGKLNVGKRAQFRIKFAALISPTNGTGEKPEPAKEEKTENTPDHAPSPEAAEVPVLKDKEKTMTDPLRFCSDSVSHPFIANSPKEFREKDEVRSSHLTWGGVWEMVAKELFSKYVHDSGVCWASRDDKGLLHLRDIGEHVGECASVIADEMLYKAREYCEREMIDPNEPLA